MNLNEYGPRAKRLVSEAVSENHYEDPVQITDEQEAFIKKRGLDQDVEITSEDGEKTMKMKPEAAKALAKTYNLFISQETADERLDKADQAVKAKTEEILEKHFGKDHGIQVSTYHSLQDSYVGSNAGAIYLDLEKDGETEEVEPSALYASVDVGALASDASQSWDWAAWLLDSKSPLCDDDFMVAYEYDDLSVALEQFAATLDESDFESEIVKAAKKLSVEEKKEAAESKQVAESTQRNIGRVTWINKQAGYGAIADDTGREYMFTVELLEGLDISTLESNDAVQFIADSPVTGYAMGVVKTEIIESAPAPKSVMTESDKLLESIEDEKDQIVDDLVKEFGEDCREEISDSLDFSSKARYGEWGEAASFKADGDEYNLIKDEDEAEKIALEIVKQDLENEPENFSRSFLERHIYIDDTTRRSIAADDESHYREELEDLLLKEDYDEIAERADESDKMETLKEKLSKAEDSEDEEQIKKAKDELEKFAKECVEEIASKKNEEVYEALEDPIQYLVKDQGIYTLEQLMKADFISIDTKEAAEEAVKTDGWAHFLSHYDNNYKTTKSGFVYFRE